MTMDEFKNPATGKDKEVEIVKNSLDSFNDGVSAFADKLSFLKSASAGLAAISFAIGVAGFFVRIS
jgi:hypothetical protein